MKTTGRILAGAGIAIAAGAAIIGIGIGMLGKKPDAGSGSYEEKTYIAAGDIDCIRTSLHAEDVVVEPADIAAVEIIYTDDVNEPFYAITEKGGELRIKKEASMYFFNIPIFYADGVSEEAMLGTVHIRVPKECVLDVHLSVTAGDVSVSDLEVGQLSLSGTSGNIAAENIVVNKDIDADTTSGDMKFESIRLSGDFQCSSTSGDVDMREVASDGSIRVSATSGDWELYDITAEGEISKSSTAGGMNGGAVSAQQLYFDATAGSICLKELTVEDKLSIDGTSMDVNIGLTDRLDHYQVSVSTISGDTNLPNHYNEGGDKKIDVSTTSGDVWFEFGNKP